MLGDWGFLKPPRYVLLVYGLRVTAVCTRAEKERCLGVVSSGCLENERGLNCKSHPQRKLHPFRASYQQAIQKEETCLKLVYSTRKNEAVESLTLNFSSSMMIFQSSLPYSVLCAIRRRMHRQIRFLVAGIRDKHPKRICQMKERDKIMHREHRHRGIKNSRTRRPVDGGACPKPWVDLDSDSFVE
ncbi:hypothetical protein R1flu_019562 [Riccia fluitans]|uniref:Uncharacterized protein n=1 Tax=Riccia fluitans TaxID=41844 RepID=A0ABD1ZIZ9_9MARC